MDILLSPPGAGGAPVSLLGYSGGGQIALATAGYVQETLRVPVQVISLAGVMSSSRSLDRILALARLYGTADRGQRLGGLIFPARWPIFPGTHWGRALAGGKIRYRCLGPTTHSGGHSYMDATAHIGRWPQLYGCDCRRDGRADPASGVGFEPLWPIRAQ